MLESLDPRVLVGAVAEPGALALGLGFESARYSSSTGLVMITIRWAAVVALSALGARGWERDRRWGRRSHSC
jgi:hypothetical protein